MKSTNKINWNRISKSFKQYLKEAEEKNVPVNEFLSKDLNNLKLAIKKFKIKVTDSKIIKNIESIIDAQLIDPYANIKSTVDQIRDYFKTVSIPKSYDQYLSQTFNQALHLSNLKALTEEEAPAEEGGDNPFAAAPAKGGDEAPAADAAAPATTPPAETPPADPAAPAAPAATPPTTPAGIPIKFDIDKVKRYNTGKFLSDAGTVKSINKKGIIVTTQPDGVDILVNFDDISENVKRFFKSKK